VTTLRVCLILLAACPALVSQQSPAPEVNDRINRVGQAISNSRLRGKPLVQFVVASDPRLAEFGITQDVLMKDVELILRRNHVALADKKEDYPKAGVFGIAVDIVAADPVYSISIRASFGEPATVLRTGDRITADVWSNGWQYVYGRMLLPKVRDNIKEAAESFALDYLRANP